MKLWTCHCKVETKEAIELFIKSRKARGLSPDTIRWYKGILYSFAQRYRELPKSPEAVEDFVASCTAGDERRHGYYRALRAMYRFLHRRFDLVNPIDKTDAPKRRKKLPKILMPDELDQLLSYPHPAKIKAALLFLIDTGCRIGELASLKVIDLSETPWGHIARVTGKTGPRLVPISVEVYSALSQELPFGYTKYRLRRLVSFAFRDAKVQGTAHTLRHTFGTLWKGDLSALQRIMGHSHITTTEIYRHLQVEYLLEQHHQYSPLHMLLSRSKTML